MDRIIEKLKKILALAERGERGEADNARRMLEVELRRYGLTMEDILTNKRTMRIFKYNSNEERQLFVQILVNYLGSKHETLKKSTYDKYQKEVYVVTDLEYVDLSGMYEFYKAQYRKERKTLLHDMIRAFVKKHNLYDSTPDESQPDGQKIDWDEWRRILALSSAMESVSYRKSITQ